MVNRVCKFAMFMLCVNSLYGCGTKIKNNEEYINDINNESTYEEYILPNDYNFNNAVSDGLVIYKNDGTIENEDKLEEFYNKSMNNEEIILHIVRYTKEGSPIVSTYSYKEGIYKLYMDSTRDRYAKDTSIREKIIKRIELSNDSYGRKIIIQKY